MQSKYSILTAFGQIFSYTSSKILAMKIPSAESPRAEMSLCRKVPMPKSPSAETCTCRKARAEKSPCQLFLICLHKIEENHYLALSGQPGHFMTYGLEFG